VAILVAASFLIATGTRGEETDRVVSPAALQSVVTAIFAACGMNGDDAHLLAETLVHSDRRGVHSHGVLRVPEYVKKLTRDGAFKLVSSEERRPARWVRNLTSISVIKVEP